MANQAKLEQSKDRLVSLSYQMAGVLQQMQTQGDIPAWFDEAVRHLLEQHAAAAKTRKEALNETQAPT